ncbi:F0F1 ATP synthase subunit delta [Tessaracoccus sp. OH4464_COT-324]|uniref:F0F1 ATP synthase subunit delta n=1 Tax=Tessaracoccus sp. OH4464_COT-324 TaxID=2491059 RepID=UPI000F63D2EE|nr:F0F1 ATP synthase subunit delta [Tessaracoccus sp. OH4464_COT-324]RRD47888.1 F0F1 ATP synthase subunit delta [Tessaracoccus sp. OH4464_COT-324]
MSGFDAATEVFQLVDVLDGQPMLRRALSDPSAQPEQRLGLARKLFASRVGSGALAALESVVGTSWRSAAELVRGLELDGVRLALRSASEEGTLHLVSAELHTIGEAVGGSAELTTTLRSASYDLEAKRGLIARLLGSAVHPVTGLLAARAVKGHKRTFSKTIADYLNLAAEISHQVVAKVTVARPLDEGRLARLRDALSARVGKPVTLQVSVDPEVLGGVSVAIGHDVYESTVAGRLEEVRRQLIHS